MSSGHSPEAWRPPQPSKPVLSVVVSEDEEDQGRLLTRNTLEDTENDQSPFFLYGERIWERKRRRIQRPMSAVPSRQSGIMDTTLSSLASDGGSATVLQRPKSSPSKRQLGSKAGRFYRYSSRENSSLDDDDSDDHDHTFITRACGTPNLGRHGDVNDPSIVLSTGLSRASTPKGRVTPHQDWEDNTSDVTKKILKSQALAQKGRQQSLYLAPSDVMSSAAARNIRGLARQIRMSAGASAPDRSEIGHPYAGASLTDKLDFPPKRPAHHAQNGFNRRATIGEIVNQRRPTLSSGAWKHHLGQTADTPMSLTARRQKVLESKKEWNESKNQLIVEKVKDFVSSPNFQQMTF